MPILVVHTHTQAHFCKGTQRTMTGLWFQIFRFFVMEDDSEPPAVEVRQNLNDLQSYLVHFNKEIGNNDVSSFQQKFISQIISASQSEKSTPSEEDLPSISGITLLNFWLGIVVLVLSRLPFKPGLEVIKHFSCSTQLSIEFKLLISDKIAKTN